jgi:hypothetical protein
MSALPLALARFDRWVLERLPPSNRDVLAGSATPEELIGARIVSCASCRSPTR